MKTATLIIDHDYSYCSACKVSVNPFEKYHDTTYTPEGKAPGCRAQYVALGTHVYPLTSPFITSIIAFHPALPFIGTVTERNLVH